MSGGTLPEKGFYVKFLGGFSLMFEGKELRLRANPLGKTMQMLFFLLKAGEEGCEKKEFLELVRPEEENRERRLNNFRQQLHMMRKLICDSHFPEGDYIVYQGSRCYFTLDYPIQADTKALDRLIGRIRNRPVREEEMEADCQAYCEGYTGEFLPFLGGEEWVAMECAYYQKWYFTCLDKLCVRLKEQKKYETLLHLAEVASQLHPYDEWQVVQIDCLMALNRRREAEKVYEEAEELFYQDLGLTSLDRVMAKYQEKGGSYHIAQAMEKMKIGLEEEERGEGAYYCSYPSFVDIYRIRVRMDERSYERSILLLCTLSGGNGGWKEAERIEQMELFRKTLVRETRAEDAYTQYSENQYLALLYGVGRGMENLTISQLKAGWKKAGGQAKVEYSIGEVEGANNHFLGPKFTCIEGHLPCGGKDEQEGNVCHTHHQPRKRNLARTGEMDGKRGNLKFSKLPGTGKADGRCFNG